MATTMGPDLIIMDRLTTENSGLGVSDALGDMPPNASPLSSPNLSPRSEHPPPNPHFVFPARQCSSTPSSFSRATRNRPGPVLDSPKDTIGSSPETGSGGQKRSPLPDFSFPRAPGSGTTSEHSFLSPAQSPQSPRAIPSKPLGAGHRRGGSEFVGGSIRAGDSITVISTSPTKSESGLASPTLDPKRPRRGHAHRRSAAISSHDLSSIILPSPPPLPAVKGSSAPTSPALLGLKDGFAFPGTVDQPEKTLPHSITSPKSESDIRKTSAQGIASKDAHLTPKPVARNRVGFSETLEFIPRPLSFVSSDTSSTATARPGHSVSGSISSVFSLTNSTLADREAGSPVGPDSAAKKSDSRPSTAGAILERTQSSQDAEQVPHSPRRRNSIPHLDQLPLSAEMYPSVPSPTRTPKRWSFFGLDPFVGSHSPTRYRPDSSSSRESRSNSVELRRPEPDGVAEFSVKEPEIAQPETKPTGRKRSKKQKKVKTWAGSILSRKSKPRHVKPKRRTPTPPPRDFEVDEDDIARRSFEMLTGRVMPTVMITDASAVDSEVFWTPTQRPPVFEEDASYPMIDLDAALGPFNTPLPRNPEWEAAQRAGGHVKKQLHSAAGMSRFAGPGMHYYHRRAESAPEMAPFEAGRFIHRFGSSSTMADVFEEDEEDDGSDVNKTTGQSTPVPETPIEGHECPDGTSTEDVPGPKTEGKAPDSPPNVQLQYGPRRKGSDLSDEERSQASSRIKSEHVGSSLHEEVIIEETDIPPMPDLERQFVPSRGSYDSPAPSPRHLPKVRDLAPVDVTPMYLSNSSLAPVSPWSMTQSSAFPSPRSPASYDAHRISTAPSSVAEDNFQSLLMGEPGPEVRISVDDIPSLRSSNSTMTKDSIPTPNPQARHALRHDQPRPASFSATAFGRRRSSLASLNRLISTSYGERSKLSMEIPLDSEPEKKPKLSKAKRISRMMQFWKPKENTPA